MTYTEMLQAFRVGYDIANLEGPGYEDSEVYILLNQAQDIEVLKEADLKRYTYISNVIVNEKGTLAAGLDYSYTKLYTPSQEYIGYISSKSKITRSTFKPITSDQWVENILIKKEVSGRYLYNSINSPLLLQPRVYEDTLKKITVIYDNYTTYATTNNFELEYLRKPILIANGVSCELNIFLHNRIVNTAVNLAKKVFNPNEAGSSAQVDTLISRPNQ
jgi:hypothetical protein